MAARNRAAKASNAAKAASSNPYVQRIIQDSDLRDNIRDAYEHTRSAYARLANGKGPSKALLEDKKLQRDLRDATVSLREVGTALKDGPRRRKRRTGRRLLILAIGAGLALALSEGLRKKVLDALFGAEEEFDYTSTTTPTAPEPAAAPTT
ncbi:MAG: hypothetical protein QOD76_531 [Solirubrobacteraceae bacterium]|jgi:hypothetical protein|nr:hypothetical protein [Solirubrobacteraceae bacterium]